MAGIILTGGLADPEFDEETHTYTDALSGQKLPSVSSIIFPMTQRVYGTIDRETLQRAADFGTAVHLCTEFLDNDILDEDSIEPEWKPYLTAYELFKAEMRPAILEIEWRVACQKYAGTIDRLMYIDGENWIVDLKTTSEIHAHVGLQLAAYEALARLNLDTTAQIKRAALQLRADGTYRFIEFKDDSDYACFNALLNIHNWSVNHGY